MSIGAKCAPPLHEEVSRNAIIALYVTYSKLRRMRECRSGIASLSMEERHCNSTSVLSIVAQYATCAFPLHEEVSRSMWCAVGCVGARLRNSPLMLSMARRGACTSIHAVRHNARCSMSTCYSLHGDEDARGAMKRGREKRCRVSRVKPIIIYK